jgi:hypothetical protein
MTENSTEKPPAPPGRLVATRLPPKLADRVQRAAQQEMIWRPESTISEGHSMAVDFHIEPRAAGAIFLHAISEDGNNWIVSHPISGHVVRGGAIEINTMYRQLHASVPHDELVNSRREAIARATSCTPRRNCEGELNAVKCQAADHGPRTMVPWRWITVRGPGFRHDCLCI